MKKYIVSLLTLFLPLTLFALSPVNNNQDNTYRDKDFAFTITIPKNWADIKKEYTAMKGGKVRSIYITQQSDITSRRTKYFLIEVGTPSSIFGLSNKVIEKVDKDELIDLYISQMYNGVIGYSVSKAYIKQNGAKKIYVVDGSYMEPGSHRVLISDYFQFENDRVYHWSINYFSNYSQHLPTLQKIADSIIIN